MRLLYREIIQQPADRARMLAFLNTHRGVPTWLAESLNPFSSRAMEPGALARHTQVTRQVCVATPYGRYPVYQVLTHRHRTVVNSIFTVLDFPAKTPEGRSRLVVLSFEPKAHPTSQPLLAMKEADASLNPALALMGQVLSHADSLGAPRRWGESPVLQRLFATPCAGEAIARGGSAP
jgi:hypothetical protein